MTEIEDIKWLREETGAGVMEAKRALQDAGGDRQKARKLMEQRGAATAAKRSGKIASQGVVEPYIHAGGQIGVLVELNSETDFVARTPEFQELAHEVALQIAATNPKYRSVDDIPSDEVTEMKDRFQREALTEGKPERIAGNIAEGKFKKYAEQVALLEQPYVRDDSKTIKQLMSDLSAKTGENIVLKRYARFQVGT
ncbi:MAG: translation elongation factor Ts [Chloroflexota bacterium]|nr:MAG: elongation factor Ts [Chloroflexota bacterium]